MWLGHHVSIHRKTVFASKQCPQVLKHFEIHGTTFAVQAKTVKTVKVLVLEHFVLYGLVDFIQSLLYAFLEVGRRGYSLSSS